MANYYGIADFAGGFNRVRDDSLNSGFRAKKHMRDDWIDDYQIPEKMLNSDVNTLNKSIAYDTLNQGYGDLVNYGLNNAATGARKSGIQLDQLMAQQDFDRLLSDAYASGARNETEALKYLQNQGDWIARANPYLKQKLYNYAQDAHRKQVGLGAAIGGPLGSSLQNQGLTGLGYGFQSALNPDENIYYATPEGEQSSTFTPYGQAQIAKSLATGDIAPMTDVYRFNEQNAIQNARQAAQFNQRDDYAQQRFANEIEKQVLRNQGKLGTGAASSAGANIMTGGGVQAPPSLPNAYAPRTEVNQNVTAPLPSTPSTYQATQPTAQPTVPSLPLPEAQAKLNQARSVYQSAMASLDRLRKLEGGTGYFALGPRNPDGSFIDPRIFDQAKAKLKAQVTQASQILQDAERVHQQAALVERERQRIAQEQQNTLEAQKLIQSLQR
jgi:hypothetical protein